VNLHASAKSCQANFSSSNGNSTNRLVNTKQFSLTHKARALALACERKKSADMEHTNQALSSRIKELEEMLARGGPLVVENTPPANAPSTCTGTSFQDLMAVNNPHAHPDPKESHDSASSDGMSDSNESKSISVNQIIPLHLSKISPVTPALWPIKNPSPCFQG
jgi:hypothetical protein